ncbi:uncharacterized protein LOC143297995 [Babylonia areolata]|uniref:uncharacterized protein LOC143297995 n=1 Tax=Babylonia areolata TaxID=304850 RepID=UPI003FD2D147
MSTGGHGGPGGRDDRPGRRDGGRGGGRGGVLVRHYRSLEEEDLEFIPQVMRDTELFLNSAIEPENLPPLHHAMAVSRPHRHDVIHHDDLGLLGGGQGGLTDQGQRGVHLLAERLQTFPRIWNGPPPRRMAEAGLYYEASGEGAVLCGYCQVRFRVMAFDARVDPMERHRDLSAACRFVRLCSTMARRYTRRHSYTSAQILSRP